MPLSGAKGWAIVVALTPSGPALVSAGGSVRVVGRTRVHRGRAQVFAQSCVRTRKRYPRKCSPRGQQHALAGRRGAHHTSPCACFIQFGITICSTLTLAVSFSIWETNKGRNVEKILGREGGGKGLGGGVGRGAGPASPGEREVRAGRAQPCRTATALGQSYRREGSMPTLRSRCGVSREHNEKGHEVPGRTQVSQHAL